MMPKITVTTWVEIETAEGDERRLKAQTQVTYSDKSLLPGIFNEHIAKVGAIERKLTSGNE